MEAFGSQDGIEDALDILRREDVHYVLVIGVPGEDQTRMYSSKEIHKKTWRGIEDALNAALRVVAES